MSVAGLETAWTLKCFVLEEMNLEDLDALKCACQFLAPHITRLTEAKKKYLETKTPKNAQEALAAIRHSRPNMKFTRCFGPVPAERIVLHGTKCANTKDWVYFWIFIEGQSALDPPDLLNTSVEYNNTVCFTTEKPGWTFCANTFACFPSDFHQKYIMT